VDKSRACGQGAGAVIERFLAASELQAVTVAAADGGQWLSKSATPAKCFQPRPQAGGMPGVPITHGWKFGFLGPGRFQLGLSR
jgi:hypothetical protein